MSSRHLSSLVGLAILLCAALPAWGQDSWVGKGVLARTPDLKLEVDGNTVGDFAGLGLPAPVLKEDGDLVWVGSEQPGGG